MTARAAVFAIGKRRKSIGMNFDALLRFVGNIGREF